jgi:hypothetical protein
VCEIASHTCQRVLNVAGGLCSRWVHAWRFSWSILESFVSENILSQPDGVGNDTTRASQRCQPNIPVNQLEPEHTHKALDPVITTSATAHHYNCEGTE